MRPCCLGSIRAHMNTALSRLLIQMSELQLIQLLANPASSAC
jgi:hypothetical protein